jgi:hypothetical protein
VVSRTSARAASVSRPDFIELSGPLPFADLSEAPGASDALVEVVAPDGARLTIRVKGATNSSVAAWVSAFRGRA